MLMCLIHDVVEIDAGVKIVRIEESRQLLQTMGIGGEVIHTLGHSDDSISLYLDTGELFVGYLNPLYELELRKGTQIEDSWNRLMKLNPKKVYYGHAKVAELQDHNGNTQQSYLPTRMD